MSKKAMNKDDLQKTRKTVVTPDPWHALKTYTPARIALGRAGSSLPTKAALEFQLAHAAARDAVHGSLDITKLQGDLERAGHTSLRLRSAAADRATYLLRPDLGRELDEQSVKRLEPFKNKPFDVMFIIGDGLSAKAVQDNAVPLLKALQPYVKNWTVAPVLVVEGARVAVTDAVGDTLKSTLSVMLIGERPGLSAADSLGIYLTYGARTGRTDAERNCISNVRPGGLTFEDAAKQLYSLLRRAHQHKLSGVALGQKAALDATTTLEP